MTTNSRGQAALLVLLTMSVALVIALSVMSRSVTDVSTSSKSEDSARAFNAAEAGIEQALLAGGTAGVETTGSFTNGSSFSVKSSPITSSNQGVALGANYLSGDTAIFWLINHDDSGNFLCDDDTHPCFTRNNFDICWGTDGTSSSDQYTPAVEISVYWGDPDLIRVGNYSDVKVARMTEDPWFPNRTDINHFGQTTTLSNCSINGTDFAFKTSVSLTPSGLNIPNSSRRDYGLLFAAVRFFYNITIPQPVGLATNPSNPLPPQGINIKSTGSVSDITRQVEVIRSFAVPPSIFDSAIFSFGAITQS